MKPSIKTLLQLQERKVDIACALISNIEDWIPKANTIEYAIEYLGLDPDEYDLSSTDDVIEIQRKWVAHCVSEQAQTILNELYDSCIMTLMDNEIVLVELR